MTDFANLHHESKLGNSIVKIAAVVVIIAGARYAASLLVPFLLSMFIAMISVQPVAFLRKIGFPSWIAVSTVTAAVLVLIMSLFVLLGSTATQFMEVLPDYQKQFQVLLDESLRWLSARGVELNVPAVETALNPARAVSFFAQFMRGVSDTFSNAILILFTVFFLLLDASTFPSKLSYYEPGRHGQLLASLHKLVTSMNEYILMKAMISLMTAVLIWIGLSFLGIRFAALWAFLAFLLNFIPTIGSIIAVIPVALLSLLEFDPYLTLKIVALYLVINTIIGNLLEPSWMGHRMGLSTLMVFLSVVFWGWMFGPVGMLLSVPLTMVLKFITERQPGTSWLAILLSAPPAQVGQENFELDQNL